MEIDNKRPKVTNWQLESKEETQRASLVAEEEAFISHNLKAKRKLKTRPRMSS